MAPSIFISYRRSDSQHAAIALAECLRWAFDDGEVFFDRMSIKGGDPWPKSIQSAVESAKVVLVVIGEDWLKSHDKYGRRRIDDPNDWVRREILTAINQNISIIPVTLDGAEVPEVEALDEKLGKLLSNNSMPVRVDSWESHIHTIISHLTTQFQIPRRSTIKRDKYPNGTPIPRPDPVLSTEPILTQERLQDSLKILSAWQLEWNHHAWAIGGTAHEISRVYEFGSFEEATEFMAKSSKAIEDRKPPHHPRWENQWCAVKVWFSTWDVGCRVTQLDVDSAKQMDSLYREHLKRGA